LVAHAGAAGRAAGAQAGSAGAVPAPILAQEMMARVKSLEERLASCRVLIAPTIDSPGVIERVRLKQANSQVPR